eukprot:11508182-Heterocapsa_arctica.AAC.1
MEAVMEKTSALQHASDDLKVAQEFVSEVVWGCCYAMEPETEKLKGCRDSMVQAAKLKDSALQELRGDR